MRNVTDKIASDYDDILAFFQAVTVKALWVAAITLSLYADKCARDWFFHWTAHHIISLSPQDYSRLTGVLIEEAMRIQNAESLRPVSMVQRYSDIETRGYYRLPQTMTRIILEAGAVDSIIILSAPLPLIHRLLNAREATALQADFALTYTGHIIYIPTSFYQYLL